MSYALRKLNPGNLVACTKQILSVHEKFRHARGTHIIIILNKKNNYEIIIVTKDTYDLNIFIKGL